MSARLVSLALLISVVASCQKESDDDDTAESGAGGAGNVYVDQLRGAGGCFPRQIGADDQGRIPCSIVEATTTSPCSCQAAGRTVVSSASMVQSSVRYLEQTQFCGEATGVECAQVCMCELEQFSGDELVRCQNDADAGDLVGFCYIDDGLMIGNPELVADCPESQRRQVRFVDPSGNTPQAGAAVLIGCWATPL